MRLILGIDPGQQGAIAAVDADDLNTLVAVVDMPLAGGEVSVPLLRDVLHGFGPHVYAVAIERVHSMPAQGVSSTFKFGVNYGVCLGVAGSLFPVVHVSPPVWKRRFRLAKDDKDDARRYAIERWPHQAHLLARKKDVGRADAALIGLYHAETAAVPSLL